MFCHRTNCFVTSRNVVVYFTEFLAISRTVLLSNKLLCHHIECCAISRNLVSSHRMLCHLTYSCVISLNVVWSHGMVCHLKEGCIIWQTVLTFRHLMERLLFWTQWKCCGATDYNDYDASKFHTNNPDDEVRLRLHARKTQERPWIHIHTCT